MSRNRHTSKLRKFFGSKARANSNRQSEARTRPGKSTESSLSYGSLESRQLLAADFITNITTDLGFAGPSVNSIAVGPAHVVAVQNGNLRIFNKATGAVEVSKPLATFWTDNGAGINVGANSSPNLVATITDPSVVYDAQSRRWFMTAVSSADVITGTPGIQNPVLLAVSRSSNPTQDWQSVENVIDINADGMMQPNELIRGGFIPTAGAAARFGTNLSVDANNIYVTTPSVSPFVPDEVWVFNKVIDLVVPTPAVPRMPVIFAMPDATVEWANDISMPETPNLNDGQFGLTTNTDGTSIELLEILNPGDPTNIAPGTQVSISAATDPKFIPFDPPPATVRQLFDPDLINSGAELTASVIRRDNSLYAVHSVLASNGVTSALRWYQIDLETKLIVDTGTIEDDVTNYIFPSITVTPKGHVAIAHTSTGFSVTDPTRSTFPAASVSVGYLVNGKLVFEAPTNLKDGDGGYFDTIGNLWSEASIAFDPFFNTAGQPDRVWALTPWSNINGGGQTQLTQVSMIGHSPTLMGTSGNDEIVVRKSPTNFTQVEVVMNGVVQASFEQSMMYRITVNGGGGQDTFVLSTINGELNLPRAGGGVEFVGDGNDIVRVDSTLRNNWNIGRLPSGFNGTNESGSGFASIGTALDPNCNIIVNDGLVFDLDFQGAAWTDATPWEGGTFGQALQDAVSDYFNNVIAPTFAGNFNMRIVLTDGGPVGSLSSSRPLGGQFINIGGQQIFVYSPYSILTGRGDTNGATADGQIDYNFDPNLYGGDNAAGRAALLRNVGGGLTRHEFWKILGMESNIANETNTNNPRGTRNTARVMDLGLRDLNSAPLLGNYTAADQMFTVQNYAANPNWSGDNSGLFFRGIADNGSVMRLPVNSNAILIDFDRLAFSFAGTSRNGSYDQIIEQDRAFLRGMGYEINDPVVVNVADGNNIFFSGVDMVLGGNGVDNFCVSSIDYDFTMHGRDGNDQFFVPAAGVGAITLIGDNGNDYYEVRTNNGSEVTVIDTIGSENDRMRVLGTVNNDLFLFNNSGVQVNAGDLVFSGVEDITFMGLEGDDTFDVRGSDPGIALIDGGAGTDKFIVNGAGPLNDATLKISQLAGSSTGRLQLDTDTPASTPTTDVYLADSVESFQVNGTFVIDDSNGFPMVTGGLMLMGDGDETLQIESMSNAVWTIDGDGSGNVALGTNTTNFMGLGAINGVVGIDTFNVTMTNTAMTLRGRDGDDIFNVANTGTGMITGDGNLGNDTFNVTNSGGGVILNGNEGMDLFTFADTNPVAVDSQLWGNEDADAYDITNSGSGTLTVAAGAGADNIILVDAGSALKTFLGGDGNDTFSIVDSGLGSLTLMGEAGDDNYVVTLVNPLTPFQIIDSIGLENDTLTSVGTALDDEFTIDGTTAVIGGATWDVVGVESYAIDGLDGNDTFNINLDPTFAGTLTLMGNLGDDTFIVTNAGAATINLLGGDGDDVYEVNFSTTMNVTISDSLGADSLTAVGTEGSDRFDLTAISADMNGGLLFFADIEFIEYQGLGGNDEFNVTEALPGVSISGGMGNDVFNIAATADGNRFAGDEGDDVFNIASTGALAQFEGGTGNDTFNVMMTTGNGTFLGGAGDDLFNIGNSVGISIYRGGTGVDTFIVTNRLAPGSPGLIDIDGDSGRSQLIVNGYENNGNTVAVSSDRISGMSAVPISYRSSGGNFTVANDGGGVTLRGSNFRNDDFRINSFSASNTLRVLGRGGDDATYVQMAALGRIEVDGGEGSDLYRFFVGSNQSRTLLAVDSGVGGTDRLTTTLTDNADEVRLGGQTFVANTDQVVFSNRIETLIVDTGAGNDRLFVNRLNVGFLRILLGAGNDRADIIDFTGVTSGLSVNAGSGDDTITFTNTNANSFAMVEGGAGNDAFNVTSTALGNVILDGQDGSDSYTATIAEISRRFVRVIDSGATGTDRFQLNGTTRADLLTFRVNLINTPHQRYFYTNNIETLVVRTAGGGDMLTIRGVSAGQTNIFTDAGNDVLFLDSTYGPGSTRNVTIDLGEGDDFAIVKSVTVDATVTVSGGVGNDFINVGSTQGQNNGVLQSIAGSLTIAGDDGNDRLHFNDFGSGRAKNYRVTSNLVTTRSIEGAAIAGSISYGGIETLKLEATNFRNRIDVTGSTRTQYLFVGKGGLNEIHLDPADAAFDGRSLRKTSPVNGSWRFTNGKRDLFFENFNVI